jgi:hypothetical protein
MNVVLGHLLVLLPEPRRLIALRQPKQNPAGEHRGGVIAARTRKGGSTFSRGQLR